MEKARRQAQVSISIRIDYFSSQTGSGQYINTYRLLQLVDRIRLVYQYVQITSACSCMQCCKSIHCIVYECCMFIHCTLQECCMFIHCTFQECCMFIHCTLQECYMFIVCSLRLLRVLQSFSMFINCTLQECCISIHCTIYECCMFIHFCCLQALGIYSDFPDFRLEWRSSASEIRDIRSDFSVSCAANRAQTRNGSVSDKFSYREAPCLKFTRKFVKRFWKILPIQSRNGFFGIYLCIYRFYYIFLYFCQNKMARSKWRNHKQR